MQPGSHGFHAIASQFKAKVSSLTGCIPAYHSAHRPSEEAALPVRPSDLSVTCSLSADGEVLGLPSRTRPKEADLDGCEWQEWLQYYIKVHLQLPNLQAGPVYPCSTDTSQKTRLFRW